MPTVVQYPCSQFDYITSGRSENDAQQLFDAWIAVHHPSLLEIDSTMPRWETASYPPFNLQQDIVIIPPCCEPYWNDDWEKQTADCIIIRNAANRDEIVQQVLAARNHSSQPFDEDFVADFYAFAAARFLLALLSRNQYHLHAPDDTRLKELLDSAIQMSRHNEPGGIQQALQRAFDELATAKDNYHAVQNYFLELILVTETTAGEPLRQLLQTSPHVNLFLPCKILQTLPELHPETFAELQSAVEKGKVHFIIDDWSDGIDLQSLALLPILDVADRVLAGISLYRDLLNISPTVYGRLTPGLSPVLPQLLKLTALKGAVHFTPLAGWKIKESEQSKIVWQGTDNSSVDALVRYPIDASSHLGFFEFADQFGTQLHQDSVPTTVFAKFPDIQSHKPGTSASGWLDILRRMNRYSTGLGNFVHIEEYFSSTAYSGGMQRFGHEIYPVDALREPVQNPISRWNALYQASRARLVQSALETLLHLLNKPVSDRPIAEQFADAMLPSAALPLAAPPDGCRIAVNPLSFARTMYMDDTPIEVPPLGYAFYKKQSEQIAGDESQHSSRTHSPQKLITRLFSPKKNKAEKNKAEPVLARQATDDIGRGEKRAVSILENRYFSAKFDATTGMLRSIFTSRSRFNQLSRQIACRNNQIYTVQCVDEIVITKSTAEIGQLKITGRLVFPEGEVAARFSETVMIRSQSRVLEFGLTLEPLIELDDDRWNSYIAVRYAWNDDALELRGNLNDGIYVLPERKHLHSTGLIDLRSETQSLTFLSEGLPFHRRSGDRQLDTLLLVKGESQRQFRLGVGVNAKNPMFVYQDFSLKQEGLIFPVQSCPSNLSSWLFQIESSHVLALHWEAVWELEKLVGYMVYLQEVSGHRAHFVLRSFLHPVRAAAMNFQGQELKPIKVQDDAVLIDMHAYEILPLRVWLE